MTRSSLVCHGCSLDPTQVVTPYIHTERFLRRFYKDAKRLWSREKNNPMSHNLLSRMSRRILLLPHSPSPPLRRSSLLLQKYKSQPSLRWTHSPLRSPSLLLLKYKNQPSLLQKYKSQPSLRWIHSPLRRPSLSRVNRACVGYTLVAAPSTFSYDCHDHRGGSRHILRQSCPQYEMHFGGQSARQRHCYCVQYHYDGSSTGRLR
jgi:hypothetical protein